MVPCYDSPGTLPHLHGGHGEPLQKELKEDLNQVSKAPHLQVEEIACRRVPCSCGAPVRGRLGFPSRISGGCPCRQCFGEMGHIAPGPTMAHGPGQSWLLLASSDPFPLPPLSPSHFPGREPAEAGAPALALDGNVVSLPAGRLGPSFGDTPVMNRPLEGRGEGEFVSGSFHYVTRTVRLSLDVGFVLWAGQCGARRGCRGQRGVRPKGLDNACRASAGTQPQ